MPGPQSSGPPPRATPRDRRRLEPVEAQLGARSDSAAVQVVPGSPSIAARAEARGSALPVHEAEIPIGWSRRAARASKSSPGAGSDPQRGRRTSLRRGASRSASNPAGSSPATALAATQRTSAVDLGTPGARVIHGPKDHRVGAPQASGTTGSRRLRVTSRPARDLGQGEQVPVPTRRPRPGPTRSLVGQRDRARAARRDVDGVVTAFSERTRTTSSSCHRR